eukprot:366391-Chlamydomonas_euryale.AAC.22
MCESSSKGLAVVVLSIVAIPVGMTGTGRQSMRIHMPLQRKLQHTGMHAGGAIACLLMSQARLKKDGERGYKCTHNACTHSGMYPRTAMPCASRSADAAAWCTTASKATPASSSHSR